MWNRLCFIRFLQVSQIFQRCRSDANKQDFENKLNFTCHAQSTPKITGILAKVFSTSGLNLVALAWMGDELSCGQAQNGVNFDFEVKFYLKGQSQSPPKNNRDLNQGLLHLWSTFGDPSLKGWWVIARTNLVTDGRTDGRTDAGNDNTRRPILASGKKLMQILTDMLILGTVTSHFAIVEFRTWMTNKVTQNIWNTWIDATNKVINCNTKSDWWNLHIWIGSLIFSALWLDKYVQRMETMKSSEPWSCLGKLCPHSYYVFFWWKKTSNKLSPHSYIFL